MRRLLLVLICALVPLPAAAQRLKVSTPVEQLEAAAKADSNDAMAHYNLAIGYWSKKRWDDARGALDACLALEPRFALAHLARAYLPFAQRSKLWSQVGTRDLPTSDLPVAQQIERDYRRAFFFDPMVDLRIVGAVLPPKSILWEADPYLSQLWDTWLRAFEDFMTGDYDAAYRRFERMAEAYNATGRSSLTRVPAEFLWYQGLAAARLGRADEAIAKITEVLQRAEKVEKGLEKADEPLIYSPLSANEYRMVLGVLLLRQGRYAEARSYFQQAVSADIGLYMAHVYTAWAHEQEGDLQSAIRERRAAVAAYPEDPNSTIELALTLAKAGANTEVERLLTEVAETNPRHPRAHYLLGVVQAQMGKTDSARQALTHFIAIAPSRQAQEIADAKRRLAEL